MIGVMQMDLFEEAVERRDEVMQIAIAHGVTHDTGCRHTEL